MQTTKGSTEREACPVEEQYILLQSVLRDHQLPATVDRTDSPRTRHTKNDITIVILAEVEEGIPPLFEGNRQCPDGALLVLTTPWLSREPSSRDVTMSSLYVHKAISMSAGQTYLDTFSPPRRATYVVNHLTGAITAGRRTEGEAMAEWRLDCPLASSMKLSARVDNKLLTRMMCAEIGVPTPVTLGLLLKGEIGDECSERIPTVTALTLQSKEVNADWLRAHVERFLSSDVMMQYDKVVVKPFGPPWYACQNVTFHAKSQTGSIVKAVLDLLTMIDPGEGILVESFLETMEPLVSRSDGRHAVNVEGIQLALRARAVVSRTPLDGARMTQIVCGIGDASQPLGGLSTISISLELMLRKWGLRDVSQQKEIRDVIRRGSEKLLLELMDREKRLREEERGGAGAQTETIGLDYVFTKKNDVITPVVIEVNSHDCLFVSTVHELLNPLCRGQAARTWVQTMVARSQRYLMYGKTVLSIGAGRVTRQLWRDAKQWGLKTVIVEANKDHAARQDVSWFLHYDYTDHTRDKEHAHAIVQLIQSRVGHVDGCLTPTDDACPLASLVAEGLNLRHTSSYTAAMSAKNKLLTMKMLKDNSYDPPHTLPTKLFSSPVAMVTGPDALEEAVKQVPLPAVMKLQFGSMSAATKHVQNLPEAAEHVQHAQATIRTHADLHGMGEGHGHGFLLMPRLMGTEHDVDVVMFEGQLMAAFLSDTGPTHEPFFRETVGAIPSVLDEEQERVLIAAAESCCRGLGLTTGVFNVEMMLTPRGPKLLEINARMSAFYKREWLRRIYHVDLLELALMAACGVRPMTSN
ncbi:hypothetical protein BaRGS_00024754, partial [Batillaria attramentaria]